MKKVFKNDFLTLIIISFILGYFLGVYAVYYNDNQPKYLMGDVNRDGKLSISDMAIIQSHILGNSKMTYEQMDLADMNNDTHIDVIDIMEIRRIILKMGE